MQFSGLGDFYFWTSITKERFPLCYKDYGVDWGSDQPDGGPGANCVAVQLAGSGIQWYDFGCRTNHRPLCITEMVQVQFVEQFK